MCVLLLCFFFFKQKTAYEMRISDWSSDVCSSDLFRWVRIVEELGSPDHCKGSFPAARMGNLAVVEKLDRLLQAICQSLVDRDFRYRAESHCSIFAILLGRIRSEEHTSELQSLIRISYAVFCLKKKTTINT